MSSETLPVGYAEVNSLDDDAVHLFAFAFFFVFT